MSWIRLDDQIAHHPKFAQCGLSSWVWVCCIAYSQKFLTDGFIPTGAVQSIAAGVSRPLTHVNRLVKARLLDKVDGGYVVHDYLVHNPSAAEVKTDREWDAFRKQLYSNGDLVKTIKQRDNNQCRYCGIEVNWNDRRSDNGGQFDHVIPRGPNTLENIVVACRRCNITKNKRSIQEAGLTLIPVKELVPDKTRTSSELVPDKPTRARAHPPDTHTHTHIKNNNNNGGPVFEGQRFVVMPFMHERLSSILGSAADAFDLGKWYWALNDKFPKDGPALDTDWPWLKKQLRMEARNRGLSLGSQREMDARENGNGHRAGKGIGGSNCSHEPRCSSHKACIALCLDEARRERAVS